MWTNDSLSISALCVRFKYSHTPLVALLLWGPEDAFQGPEGFHFHLFCPFLFLHYPFGQTNLCLQTWFLVSLLNDRLLT